MAPLPIAHRGFWWPELNHQNLPRAFEAASKAGYGLELDVRSLSGEKIVIKHGPGEGICMPLTADNFAPLFTAPLLAWNLKDIAAAELLTAFIRRHDLMDKSVIFDIELAAQEAGMPRHHGARVLERFQGRGLLARASDRDESLGEALIGPGMGVWLDAFDKDWVTEKTIRTVHAAQKAAYVVSPELHGRPLDLGLWRAWGEADGICTDFPHLLATLQGGGPLEPVDPWWGP
jgi:hypothetical protein